jgi:hypothetical protein
MFGRAGGRGATDGYALKRRVPAFLCKNEKHVPAFGYIIRQAEQAASFGREAETTKEEPNKEPRPGAINGKEERAKEEKSKGAKGKRGDGRERKPSLASHPIPCSGRINPREKDVEV